MTTQQFTKGDTVRVSYQPNPTVLSWAPRVGTFVRSNANTITVTFLDGLGRPKTSTHKWSRIASVEAV